MSRIGKKEIIVPKNVSVELTKEKIIITGSLGSLECKNLSELKIILLDNKIQIQRQDNLKQNRALHGLIRALIQNMIIGVSQQFSKTLIVEGIGYKFQIDNNNVLLSMGYSHLINIPIPEDLNVKVESLTKLVITGIDKQKIGLFASEIRKVRPPEPYKGKGIRYENEIIRRKPGKTGK